MTPVLKIPQYLPLLESLCWNMADPYALSPQEMLGIYEQYWHFKGVLANPSKQESQFIEYLNLIQSWK